MAGEVSLQVRRSDRKGATSVRFPLHLTAAAPLFLSPAEGQPITGLPLLQGAAGRIRVPAPPPAPYPKADFPPLACSVLISLQGPKEVAIQSGTGENNQDKPAVFTSLRIRLRVAGDFICVPAGGLAPFSSWAVRRIPQREECMDLIGDLFCLLIVVVLLWTVSGPY